MPGERQLGKAIREGAEKLASNKDIKEVANRIINKFGLTEKADAVAAALKKLYTGNEEATQAFARYNKNPDKAFKALQEAGLVNEKEIRKAVQQEPRINKNPNIMPEPFEQEAINVSKLPVVSGERLPVPVVTNQLEPYKYSTPREVPRSTVGELRKALPPPPGEMVPTGYGRTTFIAGEKGVSAGGQSPMGPTPVQENRTIEEILRSGSRDDLSRGMAVKEGFEEAPIERFRADQEKRAQLKDEFKRGLQFKKENFGPDATETQIMGTTGKTKIDSQSFPDENAPINELPAKSLTKTQLAGGAMVGTGSVMSITDSINAAKNNPLKDGEEVRILDEGPAAVEVLQAPRVGVASPEYLGLPPEVPTPADKLKQKPAVKPVSVRVKGQTSNKPLTETTVENAARQAKAGLDAASTIDELKKKIAKGEAITRSDLVTVFQAMEAVKPDKVETDKELTKQILDAKNEAKRAYREQADINQWSEVAQTIGNAIANFVAAQRGVADRALALPNVDYNARTMNALREYQTELSSLGEESRALERKTERETLAAERAADDRRRTMERLYLMGEKQIEAAERQAEKEQDRALQWRISQAKYDKSLADAVTKRDKDADKAAAQQGKLRASLLTKSIQDTDDLIAGLQKQIAAGTAVVNTEDKNAWDKAFNEYASTTGVTKEEARFKKEPVIFKWTDPTFDRATARKEVSLHIQQLKQQVAQETQKRNKLAQDREAAILGAAPQAPQAPAPTQAPAQAAPTPPSTGSEKPDTVVLRDPKSGKTARVPWDGAAQAKVQSGQLELVK